MKTVRLYASSFHFGNSKRFALRVRTYRVTPSIEPSIDSKVFSEGVSMAEREAESWGWRLRLFWRLLLKAKHSLMQRVPSEQSTLELHGIYTTATPQPLTLTHVGPHACTYWLLLEPIFQGRLWACWCLLLRRLVAKARSRFGNVFFIPTMLM